MVQRFFAPLVAKYGTAVTFIGTHIRITDDGYSLTQPAQIQRLVKEAIKWIVATTTTECNLTI